MQKSCNIVIKAPGFALSGASVMYLAIIYIGVMWGILITLIPLVFFFPVLKEYEWLITAPSILVVAILLLHILCFFYTVILEPNMVTLKWFGIPVRRIPISRFKTFCAVGNGREDALCLSCYSINEMANIQEKCLLRSFLDKHNVPFRKRKADWQNVFAREYLNRLRKSPFSIFKEQNVVMFKMHPALQYLTCQMYPQLPYTNYTGVTSYHVSKYNSIRESQAVCFPLQHYEYEVRIETDGIHISNKKDEVSFIPAQQIKTAVRVDVFKGYEKYYPHHMPLLFLTSMSEEELATQTSSRGYAGIHLCDTTDQALLAMMAATYLTLHWNKSHKDCCVLHHTEKNLNVLQTLYPHIHINDIAAAWLQDSSEPPAAEN